eukprot:scaffold115485_cov51-Phaeocystis_antarctica.AAC.3
MKKVATPLAPVSLKPFSSSWAAATALIAPVPPGLSGGGAGQDVAEAPTAAARRARRAAFEGLLVEGQP